MSEKRKPISAVLLKPPGKRTTKVEFFQGAEFTSGIYYSLAGKALTPARQAGRYRLRVSGKWFPGRRRVLYTRQEITKLLATTLLGDEKDV